MPEPRTFALFMGAALALLVMPGPVVLYTTARALHQGWRAGIASALGVSIGDFTYVVAATVGVSALLASSPRAFAIVKYAGAAYLTYLGVRTLVRRSETNEGAADSEMAFADSRRIRGCWWRS